MSLAKGRGTAFKNPNIKNMGLDMYAHRWLYVKQYKHDEPDERYTVQVARGGKPVVGLQSERISRVEERLMYWRKANHIHRWFVENVQDGTDDCKDYYVDEEQLRKLLAVCQEVIMSSKLVENAEEKGTEYKEIQPDGTMLSVFPKLIEDASVAQRLLPTSKGFFFGTQEYNSFYLDDVVATRDWIISTLADIEAGFAGEIYYRSSW